MPTPVLPSTTMTPHRRSKISSHAPVIRRFFNSLIYTPPTLCGLGRGVASIATLRSLNPKDT
jgi:hypothetical protein